MISMTKSVDIIIYSLGGVGCVFFAITQYFWKKSTIISLALSGSYITIWGCGLIFGNFPTFMSLPTYAEKYKGKYPKAVYFFLLISGGDI